jgi:adenylate cyclase
VRTLPLIAQLGAGHYETLALAMFRQYTGNPAVVPVLPVQHGLPRDYDALQSVALRQPDSTTKDVHEQAIPVDARVQVQVPFRGGGGPRGGSFEYLSASDLLGHRVAKLHLDGKLVLVGTSAPGVYDQRSTPVDEVYPGVEVHANLLSGLLDDRLPVRPDWTSSFEMLQLLTIAGLLGWALPRVRAARAAQIALGLVAILIVANLWSYRSRGLILPLASSLLLTALIYFGITVWGFIVEGRSRRSLERLFGTYVPPELVVEMARDPARYDMRAENRVLTIMFCDMRNFTRVAELLSPEDLRGLVNSFFSTMTHAIREQRGTLDKYIGDAIMAFWGAPLSDPSHALHAVQAALSMIERLKTLNDELRTRKLPEIGLGIGLNTGLVCVGDMGSRMRRSYTVMGDAVNLASRIEGLTRHYGVDLLVGADTHDDVLRSINTGVGATPDRSDDGVSAGLRWVEVDRVRVKGKQQPVTLFTPITVPDQGSKAFDEEMRLWQLALTAYRLQHWDEAQARLQTLQRAYAESPFARIYQQLGVRTDNYRSTSPTLDWDGAHTFDSK